MTLTVLPNDDVEGPKHDNQHGPFWEAIGDDPAFCLRFGALRKRFIVAHMVAGAKETLDPKVYVDRGKGFREEDAIALSRDHEFIVTADIGVAGTIRALRIDPCSNVATFRFEARAFTSRAAAQAYIQTVSGPSTRHIDLGNLPKFRWNFIPSTFKRKALVQRYAAGTYELAAKLTPEPYVNPQPWLSVVVPTFNTPTRYLDELLRSFQTQKQKGVELILSDDCSTASGTRRWLRSIPFTHGVKVVFNATNGGIAAATNAGLKHAAGDWVAFLDHDDLIAPHAFTVIKKALGGHPDAVFLYTDELVVDENLKPTGVMLKPAYDPVLLTGVNYINHFSIYRRERLNQLGYLRSEYDGSQDYDLLLRFLEGQPEQHVLHLPYPAYWWRRTGTTYSRTFIEQATANGRKAIADHFGREGASVRVEPALTHTLHQPVFEMGGEQWPKVSIVIPSKDNFELISKILEDIFNNTDYKNFEVIVSDNGSTDPRVLSLYHLMTSRHSNFTAEIIAEKFNFSRSINRGLRLANGEHFLFLNNDVEVIDGHWLKEMVSCLKFKRAGVVGAKLLFPNGNIQHAGVVVGFGGLAGHWYLNKPGNFGGPMNRLHVRNSLTCVTGAVMLVSGECLRVVGQWDEDNFAVAYNDVDYCLRATKAGFRVIWTPFACLRHHESVSRGAEMGKEKRRRFETEKSRLRDLHGTQHFSDPALNPNFSRDRSTPQLMLPGALFKARPGGQSKGELDYLLPTDKT